MAADPLLERLQRAVAPDYRVERRLGGGGMGYVYVAHEIKLNRPVAIKVLRPELDTADGGEAFLREAQTLASIRHPNVVVIYRPGEGEGLQFYFMELVNGPTLEARLAAGRIPAEDVVRIGINLLDGLGDVHRLGIVHRDIKPSNVFLLPNRAVLGDFGIARPPSDHSDAHNREGTPDYMAPEQVAGRPVTSRSDIYSTGVVLYEAASGGRRRFHEQGEQVDWSGIPHDLARVVRRAVEKRPEDRWPDAVPFRTALEPIQAPRVPRIAAIIGGAALVAGGTIGAIVLLGPRSIPPTSNAEFPNVAFDRIEYAGPADRHAIADSLVRMVRSDLSTHVNFVDSASPSLVVRARMTVSSSDVSLHLTGGIPASAYRVPLDRWSDLRDSVSYQIVLGVWADRSPLAASLPVTALPHTSEGLARFLEAERYVANVQWEKADSAYRVAEATDSTCWICSWRVTEIARWRSQEPDPRRVRRILVHADSLPPLYRSLIISAQLPLPTRLDTLRAVAERSRDFLAWFQLGDELFHRGPLVGHRRTEALPAFERAARQRPDFGPAWEHLAWVATAEGDSLDASEALDSLERRSPNPDPLALELRGLLNIGFAWRFFPERQALAITSRIVTDAGARSSPDLSAGPRLLPTFDVPRGAIAFGQILEASHVKEVSSSGLIAQMLGMVAVGRIHDAVESAQRLTDVAPEAELGLFTAELQATLALLDSGSVPVQDALDGLQQWTGSDGVQPFLQDRARWMSALLGRPSPLHAGHFELQLFLEADSLAAAGQPSIALILLDQVKVDSVARSGNPFFRTVVHMRRAAWRAQIGEFANARRELIWHEHLDLVGLPTSLPQAAEVDWAFRTLARWRLARLLDRGGRADRGEACHAYAAVIRNWSGAPAPYGARADTARNRVGRLSCATPIAR